MILIPLLKHIQHGDARNDEDWTEVKLKHANENFFCLFKYWLLHLGQTPCVIWKFSPLKEKSTCCSLQGLGCGREENTTWELVKGMSGHQALVPTPELSGSFNYYSEPKWPNASSAAYLQLTSFFTEERQTLQNKVALIYKHYKSVTKQTGQQIPYGRRTHSG